jgi:hypothetical protein
MNKSEKAKAKLNYAIKKINDNLNKTDDNKIPKKHLSMIKQIFEIRLTKIEKNEIEKKGERESGIGKYITDNMSLWADSELKHFILDADQEYENI